MNKKITQWWGVKMQATCKSINPHTGTQASVDIGCSVQNMRAEERVLEVEKTLAKRMMADLKVLG